MSQAAVREVTVSIRRAERELTGAAGSFLHNIVRDRGVTCAVCATPVSFGARCLTCERADHTAGLGDTVVPLTYGITGHPSAAMLQAYKNDPQRPVRTGYARIVDRLLYLGLMLHERCVEVRVGQRTDLRLTIPSLKGRPGAHPLLTMALKMNAVNKSPLLTAQLTECYHRDISEHKFELKPRVDLTGRHVLLLDDTWTTGANAHSAALTLRRAGAHRISVIVIGRWLVPRFGCNAQFIRDRLQHPYDPRLCPVTGGDCP
jgi:predicted amidophosphoribosyltransferase